jgi:hypothetical protein
VRIVRKILFAMMFLGALLFVGSCILGITVPLADQAGRKIVASVLFSGAAILSFGYAGLLIEILLRWGKIKNGWILFTIHYPFFTLLGAGFIILASKPELVSLLLVGRRCPL